MNSTTTGVRGLFIVGATIVATWLLTSATDSDTLTEIVIGRSAQGREIRLLRIGTGDADSKPGVLILGAVDARQQYAAMVARQVADKLADAAQSDSQMLEDITYYVLPWPSPDGAARFEATPRWETADNFTPFDDDRDGAVDEDGPEDLNGDGMITLMRLVDPAGGYTTHPLDARVLISVKPENGEVGQYALHVEGVDDDGDEQWNEDGVGGVDFNRNFPFDYPYFQPGAGAFQCCEPESKAVADWLWERVNIAAVITIGGDDNMRTLWSSGQDQSGIKTSLQRGDQPYYEKIAEKYKELAPRDGSPPATEQGGSLLKWAYFHYGRWAFGVIPWWAQEPKKEVEEVKDEPATEKTEATEPKPEETAPAKPKWDEKDKRGEDELRVLKWMDSTGVNGFAAWTRIEHPDFPGKIVEVGGIKPYAVTPPESEIPDIVLKQTAYAQAIAQMLPRINLMDVKSEDIGGGLFRVSAKLVNVGALPTVSEMGETTRVPYPLQITLGLPKGATLITGRERERVSRLLGGGGSIERAWVVQGEDEMSATIKVASPSVGSVQASVQLRGGAR